MEPTSSDFQSRATQPAQVSSPVPLKSIASGLLFSLLSQTALKWTEELNDLLWNKWYSRETSYWPAAPEDSSLESSLRRYQPASSKDPWRLP